MRLLKKLTRKLYSSARLVNDIDSCLSPGRFLRRRMNKLAGRKVYSKGYLGSSRKRKKAW